MPRTFSFWVAIMAQQTFRDDELEQDPEGALGDLAPREDLVEALQERIRESVSQYLHVTEIEIEQAFELGRDPD